MTADGQHYQLCTKSVAECDICTRYVAALGQTQTVGPASASQVGGEHYADMKIQPVAFIHANGIQFCEGAAIKYICRHRRKNKAEDIRKAIHFLQLLLELEYGEKS